MADEIGKLISSNAISGLINKIKTNDNNTLNSAKEYSNSLASNYATAAQGNKADSALQSSDITTGDNNGTIKVKGTNISVKGLKSAAYTDSNSYDFAGAAAGAESRAKAYADSLAVNYDSAGAAAGAESRAKAYADSLAINYDSAGAAAAVQAASEPKKIVGVIKIGPPASSTTQISNITKYYANLSNAQSNKNAISFDGDFIHKTIIISPATDTDWILWRDSGIRCSDQTSNTINTGDSTVTIGSLTFTAEENFSTTTPTYANIIILN